MKTNSSIKISSNGILCEKGQPLIKLLFVLSKLPNFSQSTIPAVNFIRLALFLIIFPFTPASHLKFLWDLIIYFFQNIYIYYINEQTKVFLPVIFFRARQAIFLGILNSLYFYSGNRNGTHTCLVKSSAIHLPVYSLFSIVTH